MLQIQTPRRPGRKPPRTGGNSNGPGSDVLQRLDTARLLSGLEQGLGRPLRKALFANVPH